MAVVVADRVKVRSYTNGTGTLTLGPVLPGFQSFEAVGNSNETYYAVTSNANEWEIGRGTYTKVGPVETLSRDTIIDSSNSGSLVNFTGGGKTVFCTLPSSVAQSFIVGAVADSFKYIAVATQSNVVADSSTDTLTLAAGNNIGITTDALTDTITFATNDTLNVADAVVFNNTSAISTGQFNSVAASSTGVVYIEPDFVDVRTMKLVAHVECTVGATYHSQACEILVTRNTATPPSVVCTVYGLIYTSVSALCTFNAQWNNTTSKIEITATNLSSTNTLWTHIAGIDLQWAD
jgi:hypothetical protein